METGTILLAALLVGLVSLDHVAFGQLMISQPLVGGVLLGAALGRPAEGLAAGAFMQLLCLTELPVGAYLPPDGSLAGLTGTALVLVLTPPARWSEASVMGLAVALFFPVAYLGRGGEVLVRRVNRLWTSRTLAMIDGGRCGAAQLAALGGVPIFFAKSFLICLAVLWSVAAASGGLAGKAAALGPPLEVLARVTPFAALGVAAGKRGARGKRPEALAALGLAAGALVSWRVF